MVRLLDFGNIRNQCISMNGLDRERRKALLAEELNKLGRKVALRSFTGVLAKQRQTIWGADLVPALERAGEYWVAVVILNQKSTCFVQAPLFGIDDCLSRMAELPQEVNGIAMPAGILDFGYNIPDDCIDLFHIGEGSGWGSGQCYPMLDLDEFGSVQLEKPAWQSLAAETFQILRVIMYPLVLHCLNLAGKVFVLANVFLNRGFRVSDPVHNFQGHFPQDVSV